MHTKLITSLSINEDFQTDNKGLFLIPSDIYRDLDHCIVTCANEYGKLEYTNVNGFLGLSDFDYNEIKISYPKNNQVLTFCENNKWMNRDPPPLKNDVIYYYDGSDDDGSVGTIKPCPNAVVSRHPPTGTGAAGDDLTLKGTLSVDSIRMTNDKYRGTIIIDLDTTDTFTIINTRDDTILMNIIHYTGEYITDGIPSIRKTNNGFKIINLGTNKLKGQVTLCYCVILCDTV